MFSVGEGVLIGLAWGQKLNDRDFAAERRRLRQELEDANIQTLGAKAVKDASNAVLNEVVRELAAERAGKLKVRRLSDPNNVAGRTDAFMDTANGQLRRLSEGRLQYFPTMLQRNKVEVREVLADPMLAPRTTKIYSRR